MVQMNMNLCGTKNFDTSSILPSQGSLNEHSRRANFQAAIWKRAHLTEYDVPAPTDGHGWEVSKGSMEPEWNSTDMLPQSIVDLLAEELQSVSWILAEFYFNRGLQRLYTGTCIILQKTINGFLCLLIVFLKSKTYQLILKDVIKLNRNLR